MFLLNELQIKIFSIEIDSIIFFIEAKYIFATN